MISYLAGYEEIKRYAKACWDTSTQQVLETKCKFLQYGVEERNPPKLNEYYGRLQVSTLNQQRVSLGRISDGLKRHRTHGLITVTVYGPKSEPMSFDTIRKIANSVRIFYSDRTVSDITYTNCKISESSLLDQQFYKMNSTCEYYFDEGL